MENIRRGRLGRGSRVGGAPGETIGVSAGVGEDIDGGRVTPDVSCAVEVIITVVPEDGGDVEFFGDASEVVGIFPASGGFGVGRGGVEFT